MEYMAFGLPVVAFDLRETRVSAQGAAMYVETNKLDAYAHAIVDLVDRPEARALMGRLGRERVERELAWQHQRAAYTAVFDELVGKVPPSRPVARVPSQRQGGGRIRPRVPAGLGSRADG
jgi:glycosyltransferase involved in cell wall biosynthesis